MSLFNPTVRASLVVALGGSLLGFDSAVVSGVMEPVRNAFDLTPAQLGWTGSCLILGAMIGNAAAGPLSNRHGRRTVLIWTALLFTISALWSALATGFASLVVARIIGGLGVGAAILIAPVYIAEIAPPEKRGRLVSFNQLNIVIGISAAFFSNYAINAFVDEAHAWRVMLGVEAVPALLYFVMLWTVPRSPRWLIAQGRRAEAEAAFLALGNTSLELPKEGALLEVPKAVIGQLGDLFSRRLSRIMTIALGLAFFQQITGINAIFYYAATIFEKAGAGTESALRQGIIIGLVNLVFTLVAMRLIDRVGRKPLLLVGSAGMAVALLLTSSAFHSAEYGLDEANVSAIREGGDAARADAFATMVGQTWSDRDEFLAAARTAVEENDTTPMALAEFDKAKGDLAKLGLVINGRLVLIAIMLFIASFAVSLGPVMWAMLAEIFPNQLRGTGISVAGLFNSIVSFTVVQVFPVGLDHYGPGATFLAFGILASLAFVFTLFLVPETKGRSLEQLELELTRA